MGRNYANDSGYTGYKIRDLLRALGNGAVIITTDPRWLNRPVEYRPRDHREVSPWHVLEEPYGWVRSTFCKPVKKDGSPWVRT